MVDQPTPRNVAKDLVELLNNSVLHENKESRTFFTEQRETLQKALDEAATPETYKVAVVGSFKVGKSSFVNALCGIKGLASVKSNPETAAITVFRVLRSRPFGQSRI